MAKKQAAAAAVEPAAPEAAATPAEAQADQAGVHSEGTEPNLTSWRVAANCARSVAALFHGELQADIWLCGNPDHYYGAACQLQAFVRANDTAPPEALFRWASAQGLHLRPGDGWADLPIGFRAAYGTFAMMVRFLDWQGREADAEEEARALAEAPAPVAAAFLAAPEDTILEQQPDPLARRDGFALTSDAPAAAASE